MQEGDFEVLQREIEVVCEPKRCIVFVLHQRDREARKRVHEETEKPARLQPQLGEDARLPAEGKWRGHIEEGDELGHG